MQQCDRGHCSSVSRQNSICVMDVISTADNGETEETLTPSAKSESEEEDYESFFLQPALFPYNIKDKLIEANKLLQEQVNAAMDKESKVKFREVLVDFEPDLTDDDVQSIESYTEEAIHEELKYIIKDQQLNYIIEEDIIEECIVESIIELNHNIIANQQNEDDNIEEVPNKLTVNICNEVVEEVVDEDTADICEDICEDIEDLQEDIKDSEESQIIVIEEPSFEINSTESEVISEPSRTKKRKKKFTKTSKKLPREIDCKKHCIEHLESPLDVCIGKLQINEKPPMCPMLKLHQRKCCENQQKIHRKLPLYTGARSEYGLSSAQIEQRAKRKDIIKAKEEKERALNEAYRRRKVQQNEIIFRQWLKDISNRRQAVRVREREIINAGRSRRIGLAEKHVEKARPKTANCITSIQLPRTQETIDACVRKRPHTTSSSTARIFIEIPKHLVQDGFQLGDLFTAYKDKRIHMITNT